MRRHRFLPGVNGPKHRYHLAEHEETAIDIPSFLQHFLTGRTCFSQSFTAGQINERHLSAFMHHVISDRVEMSRFEDEGEDAVASTRVRVELVAPDSTIAYSLLEHSNEIVSAMTIHHALILNKEAVFCRPSHKQTLCNHA